MQPIACSKRNSCGARGWRKTLTLLLLVLLCASAQSQVLSLSLKKVPLEKAFREIERQSTYRFSYTAEQLEHTRLVSLSLKEAPLQQVLQRLFQNQPLAYTLDAPYIIIRDKAPALPQLIFRDVTGQVTEESGAPLPGASVWVKEGTGATATDEKGWFALGQVPENATLMISSVGYQTESVPLNGRTQLSIRLHAVVSALDETVVIAYGTTTRRFNTGDVSKVGAEEIGRQPVSNPLAALQGRVPGLLITQGSGVPGASFKVQIRGQNSIAQGSDPLFIIDGVPFAPNNSALNQLASAASVPGSMYLGGLSPFNLISPSDIESIEVLKDADATAIYGSRGANGVVLITTKKGNSGRSHLTLNVYSGISQVSHTATLLATPDYLDMRHEAFKNDGMEPQVYNAPDLLLWDTTRYTDFIKQLIGRTAHTTNAALSFSGGSENTQFLMGAAYYRQTTVYPSDHRDQRSTMHFNITHHTPNKKFSAVLTGSYAAEKNDLPATDLTQYITLPPDYPSLMQADGTLNWQEGGASFVNPLGSLRYDYTALTNNILGNLQLTYTLLPHLSLKSSLGYNFVTIDETSLIPQAAQDPEQNPYGTAQFGSNRLESGIIEPQLLYDIAGRKGKLNVLAGGTWQAMDNKRATILATGYTNDALLKSLSGASSVTATNALSQYRYGAVFGRLTYSWQNQLILNVSGRRDGSSRFGPHKQFALFGAAGAAWIFTAHKRISKALPWLSFGKLRGSYGSTGNDQIGDYQYLNTWTPSLYPYTSQAGLYPTRLYNPDFAWELNRKGEAALELGLFKDLLQLSLAAFRNRSSNQLINYTLPTQTGFSNLGALNFPAVVQNSGLEATLMLHPRTGTSFRWNSSLVLTFSRNKLVAFPGLETSSYNNLVVGQPLSVKGGYRYLGVDPSTGLYSFEDVDKDGVLSYPNDYHKAIANTDPRWYGGFSNTLSYKGWELYLFFDFRRQTGPSALASQLAYYAIPGLRYNQPDQVQERWRKPGDIATQQQVTASYTPAFIAATNLLFSDGIYTDASFLRLKNAALTYTLPNSWLKRITSAGGRLFIQGQNLLLLTPYKGTDPEIQNLFVLPPLRTLTAGLQITF